MARCVVRAAVESNTPPNFLYATTSAGRYNPEKVESIYWSEDETVARLEYRRYHKGAETYETFFCRYSVNVVDLGDSNVVSALGLNPSSSDARAIRIGITLEELINAGVAILFEAPDEFSHWQQRAKHLIA